jgi:hypothetical protein
LNPSFQSADSLLTAQDRIGCLRGSNLLVDGRAARYARNIATAVLMELISLVHAHASEGGEVGSSAKGRNDTNPIASSQAISLA